MFLRTALLQQRRATGTLSAGKIGDARWLNAQQVGQGTPRAFVGVLVSWLVLLFAGFGLFVPHNLTSAVVLTLCALVVVGAVGMFLELEQGFERPRKQSREQKPAIHTTIAEADSAISTAGHAGFRECSLLAWPPQKRRLLALRLNQKFLCSARRRAVAYFERRLLVRYQRQEQAGRRTGHACRREDEFGSGSQTALRPAA